MESFVLLMFILILPCNNVARFIVDHEQDQSSLKESSLSMADERARIRVVKKKHVDRLLAWPNVTAVDINHRTVGGQKTDQISLVIWVKNKKPESEIPPSEILPKEIDGVPVDVFEGEAKLGKGFSWPETQRTEEQSDMPDSTAVEDQKLRPLDTLRGGDSLGISDDLYRAGTLGYFVRRSGVLGILSNAHVMQRVSNKLISPAKADGGRPSEDYIGKVKVIIWGKKNVDCGFAPLRNGRMTKFKLKDGTSVTGTVKASVESTPRVKFCGRSSGTVSTTLSSVDWSGTISGVTYHDQILIHGQVKPGDSGSLLVDRDDNKAIGLIFGEVGTKYGVANAIGDVLAALGAEIAK